MKNRRLPRMILIALACITLTAGVAAAQGLSCTCASITDSICSRQGFRINLVDFRIDSTAGTSIWDYEICDESGLGTGCESPKDLSHVDFNLSGLGACLSDTAEVTLTQIDGFDDVIMSCGVSEKDPSCDLFGDLGTDFVAKCDVEGIKDLDPGECATMRLEIAGETPTLGAGSVFTLTKAGPECGADCILGPSCEPCAAPPTTSDECLTRTIGFWGTHPHITSRFLPLTVCGVELSSVEAGGCDSASEALCVSPGVESSGNPQYAQLVRQLTGAKLNVAATGESGGFCEAIESRIAECEELCGADGITIGDSGCIDDLAEFNESLDTFATTPSPFDRPGPALTAECISANGNGTLIGDDCVPVKRRTTTRSERGPLRVPTTTSTGTSGPVTGGSTTAGGAGTP